MSEKPNAISCKIKIWSKKIPFVEERILYEQASPHTQNNQPSYFNYPSHKT